MRPWLHQARRVAQEACARFQRRTGRWSTLRPLAAQARAAAPGSGRGGRCAGPCVERVSRCADSREARTSAARRRICRRTWALERVTCAWAAPRSSAGRRPCLGRARSPGVSAGCRLSALDDSRSAGGPRLGRAALCGLTSVHGRTDCSLMAPWRGYPRVQARRVHRCEGCQRVRTQLPAAQRAMSARESPKDGASGRAAAAPAGRADANGAPPKQRGARRSTSSAAADEAGDDPDVRARPARRAHAPSRYVAEDSPPAARKRKLTPNLPVRARSFSGWLSASLVVAPCVAGPCHRRAVWQHLFRPLASHGSPAGRLVQPPLVSRVCQVTAGSVTLTARSARHAPAPT